MSESYDVGTRAWQVDQTEGWVASEVIKKTVDGSKVTLVFKLENGDVSYIIFPGPMPAICFLRPPSMLTFNPVHRLGNSRSLSRPFRPVATRHYHR